MEIRFHLPDFMRHFKLNLTLVDYMNKYPEKFRDNVKIGSVYGAFPNMTWNGGRYFRGKCDSRILKEIVNQFNKRGIPCRFTLTNPVLTPQHLSDALCNAVLKAVNNGLNEAIVCSPLLEDYIRDKFPGIPITSSTCKQIEDFDELCAELEKDYSLVVLDYNFNNNFDVLEKLPHKEKAELLINPCCDPHCKRRGEHYRSIGRSQIALTEHMMKKTDASYTPEPFECACMMRNLYQTVNSPLHVSPVDIYEKYVPMGFCNFKIEGRSVPDVNILENYVYYMVKPELKDEVRLELITLLTKNIKYFS